MTTTSHIESNSIAHRACKHAILASISHKLSTSYAEYIKYRTTSIASITTNAITMVNNQTEVLSMMNQLMDAIESFVNWCFSLPRDDRSIYVRELIEVADSQILIFKSHIEETIVVNSMNEKMRQLSVLSALYCRETLEEDIQEMQSFFTDLDDDISGILDRMIN